MDFHELAQNIKVWGRELGFSALGISDADLRAAEPRLLEWLAQGRHGEMDYMASHGVKRSRPAELLPGTVRVISARMDYFPQETRDSLAVLVDGERAFISRYALGRDYHKTLRARLQQLATRIQQAAGGGQVRVFTDSAPVMETELAVKSGIGWRTVETSALRQWGKEWLDLRLFGTNSHNS